MESESLIENLPIGIFELACNTQGEVLRANSEFKLSLGYEDFQDINGFTLADHFHSAQAWEDFYLQLQKYIHIAGYEVQLKSLGGSKFWASINVSLVCSPDGKDKRIIGTIENVDERKFEELRSLTHMELLREASLSLTRSLDLKDVLDTIAQCAMDLVPGMRNCHIFLYQPDNGEQLVFGTALWGDGKKSRPFSQPRPNGLTMRVAQSGEPILITDFRKDPIYINTPESWTGSIIGLPLKIGERVVGVMNVSHTEPGALSELNLELLRMFADHAAIAIENARLYEAAATEERHLSLVYEIGRELTKFELWGDFRTCSSLNL